MNGRIDRRLVLLLALLGLVGVAYFVVRFAGDPDEGPALTGGRDEGLDEDGPRIRRRSSSSRSPSFRAIGEEDDWEPFVETEEERQKIPVFVRAQILETGNPLKGADVSLLARQREKGWRRMIHGRLEEPGLYFFRMPQGYEAVGARLVNGPPNDREGAFVAGSFFVDPRPLDEGFELIVTPSLAPAISGRVVDATGGGAIADAEVLVKGGEWRKPWTTRTSERGEFRLQALRFAVDEMPAVLDLVLRAPGYVERHLAVDLAAGAPIRDGLELALAPALRLGGRVVDENGSPVPDLEIALLVEPGRGAAPIRPIEALLESRADGGGRFVFEGVPGGRALELRVEAEGFLPRRLRLDPLERERGDVLLRMRRGRRLGLDLVQRNGAPVEDKVVRVFARDDRRDWCVVPLDVLSEGREIAVADDRRSEILVFVQAAGGQSRRPAVWWRGRVVVDPAANLDRVTVPLEAFGDARALAPDAGLGADCVWGVQVKVAHPGEAATLQKFHLRGRNTYEYRGLVELEFLLAPGAVLEFAAAGAAPQRYLVVGEPGSRLRLEARPRPADRAAAR